MKTILKIVCMHCGCEMGEKDGEGVEGVSHSICRACWYERYPGLYPEEERKFLDAVTQCEESAAPDLPQIVVFQGFAAQRTKARASHHCSVCPIPISARRHYYSVVVVGGGLGSIKFPDRTHLSCLPAFFKKYPRLAPIVEVRGPIRKP